MLQALKNFAKSLPLAGPLLSRLRGGAGGGFTTSSEYWDLRYRGGGNSGAGSYNRLAAFKAEVLNTFVRTHGVQTVIEFGSGDGAQLQRASYPSYTGVDVSPKAVELCRTQFAGDASKRFLVVGEVPEGFQADLALSLDVIYHLVEDPVFDRYMRDLFAAARRFVIVYSSNKDEAWPDSHVRHRQFTRWVAQNQPGWRQTEVIKNAYPYDKANPDQTSFADFYVFAPQ